MQNIMIKQEKHTHSRKIKQKNTALKAVLILAMLCIMLSTIAQAVETQINLNRITSFEMYGYDSSVTTQAWRTVTYTMTSANSLETSYFVYGQSRQRIYLSFPSTITIKQFNVEYDIIAENITYTGESNSAVRVPQTSSTWNYGTQTLTDEVENNGVITRTYHVKVEKNGININSGTMSIYTYFGLVSTKYSIKNFKCIINDETYVMLNDLENTQNEISEGVNDIVSEFIEGGKDALPTRLQRMQEYYEWQKQQQALNGYKIDVVVYDNILNGSPTIVIVITMSMLISIISYLLFGKLV